MSNEEKLRALLAEPVENWKQAAEIQEQFKLAAMKERDEARSEVGRLRSLKPIGTYSLDWNHEQERMTVARAAYQRGAEAMREAAAKTFECNGEGGCFAGRWADRPCLSCGRATDVRALPLPEDKP